MAVEIENCGNSLCSACNQRRLPERWPNFAVARYGSDRSGCGNCSQLPGRGEQQRHEFASRELLSYLWGDAARWDYSSGSGPVRILQGQPCIIGRGLISREEWKADESCRFSPSAGRSEWAITDKIVKIEVKGSCSEGRFQQTWQVQQ